LKASPPTAGGAVSANPMVRQRVRIRFSKKGDLRLIGHRDLVRSMERLFRRAGLTLARSEGFHPKPRMSFPSALAVGLEGLDEVMELELAEPATAEALRERLAPHAMPGLEFLTIEVLPSRTRKAQLQSSTYEVPLPAPRRQSAADRMARLMAAPSFPIRRPHRQNPVDLRQALEELSLQEGVLRMRLRAARDGSAGPRDVLAALELSDLEQEGLTVTRTRVELVP
jgi:radical SAM-linked protein